MIERLPRQVPEAPGRPEAADFAAQMRKVTRQIAFEPEGWTPERAAKVGALFDGLATGWEARQSETRMAPLRDALERGDVRSGRCLEVGAGTGTASRELARRFDGVVSVDLSMEMLRRAPVDVAARVRADGASLPLAPGSVQAMVLVNAFLFPAEVDRVLAEDGSLVWVSTNGDRTPIHLSADEVVQALPGAWSGRASEAGWGSWCVLSRDSG